jgi:PAS domain S-box-containing protein
LGPSKEENPQYEPRLIAQARLAAIVESSDDAIVSKSLEGIVRTWNKGAERIFGWTAEEMIGQPITKIIPPDRQGEEPKILEQLRRGDRVDHFETIRITKDGRLLNVSVTVSPIRNASGNVIGASKIARDITLQKKFEQELKVARDAADQARRSAEEAMRAVQRAREQAESANLAKDQFLSVLSHELRTPLTPVLGAISMMEQDASVPPELLEQVGMIRRNIEMEARLVDDLLDLTRISSGKIELHFEAVDAHGIVRNVVSMFTHDTEHKGLTVSLSLRAKRHHVWADAGRFQQVLLNLMSNAVKFTRQGGTISVHTSNENGTLRMDVSDTGVGIDPRVLPKLFEPFEQGEIGVTRRFGGLGLGLSIVKSLVQMHKASISATSEGKDRGATFTLRLDTVPAAPRTAPAGSGTATADRKRCRLLLVEDHADTREVMCRLLRSMGCDVVAAGSVKEAIEAADRQRFDLLLSDIGLPDGSGTEIMKYIAQRRSDLKGIALTGYGQDEDLRRSLEAGFATHLTKPITVQALQDVIVKLTR